jgi:hypothetical protein
MCCITVPNVQSPSSDMIRSTGYVGESLLRLSFPHFILTHQKTEYTEMQKLEIFKIRFYLIIKFYPFFSARYSARPDWPWGPPSLLYNGYRVSPGGKVRPGRAADHSPLSSAAVMEE